MRSFAAERVIDAKVPKRVAIVATLPRTATGKVVRHELRALVEHAHTATAGDGRPQTILEADIIERFEAVLEVGGLRVDDDFFSHGGDQLQAQRVSWPRFRRAASAS